jgi:putative methyltransferase (TIGR04325 family)
MCPPIVWSFLTRIYFPSIRYRGNFENWQLASQASEGYSSEAIIRKVVEATDQVLAGKGSFERDGVVFDAPDYPYNLIAPALTVALENKGQLLVLDFGGALGSTYRRMRPLLNSVASIEWSIVEQEHFVTIGRQKYSNDELVFFSFEEYKSSPKDSNILIFSSVLQYLEYPEETFERLAAELTITDIVIDRTPFSSEARHKIVQQVVPSSIYKANYPMWIFSEQKFIELYQANWSVITQGSSLGGHNRSDDGTDFEYRFIWLKRKRKIS